MLRARTAFILLYQLESEVYVERQLDVAMPRSARKKGSTGIYHAMLRGINKQTIFGDDEDNGKFLQIIKECKEVCGFKLYGYCLMGNHAHLLIHEESAPLEQIFRRIGSRYVYWYNRKYNRVGHLFQDRYKSEPVENDRYFLTVLRYIHRNPTKAGLCKTVGEYKWSSYNEYIRKSAIIDSDFALEIIGRDRFVDFMNEESDDQCLDYFDPAKRMKDDELIKEIEKRFSINAQNIAGEQRDVMKHLLREILKIDGVSTRQLSRVTGVSTNIIWGL